MPARVVLRDVAATRALSEALIWIARGRPTIAGAAPARREGWRRSRRAKDPWPPQGARQSTHLGAAARLERRSLGRQSAVGRVIARGSPLNDRLSSTPNELGPSLGRVA